MQGMISDRTHAELESYFLELEGAIVVNPSREYSGKEGEMVDGWF